MHFIISEKEQIKKYLNKQMKKERIIKKKEHKKKVQALGLI
jgi:hypothetical protein